MQGPPLRQRNMCLTWSIQETSPVDDLTPATTFPAPPTLEVPSSPFASEGEEGTELQKT